MAHWGIEQFSNNFKRLKRTDFSLRLGRPFHIKTDGGKLTRNTRQEIVDEIMGQIAALMPEEYRGEYAGHACVPPKFIQYLQ